MNKTVSIIIIGILISCSFSVQGIFFKKTPTEAIETTTNGIHDFLFDKKMEMLMKMSKFPSISACIIDENEIIWSKGYGYYDLEYNKIASDNTIYNIGSITKTIVGTALMQLWEQGLFDLDEDVNKYLPFNLRNPHFPDDPITFRMLLSHSSSLNTEQGISSFKNYVWSNFSSDPPFSFYPDPWLEEHLTPYGKWYYPQRWSSTYRPGEHNMYANVGFNLIGYLVELISGQDFFSYIKENIFIPLMMFNTSFNLSELDIDEVAIPYHYHNGQYFNINELEYLLGEYTPPVKYWKFLNYHAGGLYSTVTDLSHFFIAHMNGGKWNDVRILEYETVQEMHRIQPPGDIDPLNYYFALAWLYQEFPFILNITFSGHTGGIFGVGTMMFYLPEENIGIIFYTNGDTYYEDENLIPSIASVLLLLNLFKKGGVNLLSYID